MKVKALINELLDMPMDADVQIVYVDKNYDYEYQEVTDVLYYDEDNEVGILGGRQYGKKKGIWS